MEVDSELIYYRSRYYNPADGRFIRKDAFGGRKYNPVSLNRYIYVNNRPISLIDSYGYEGFVGWLGRKYNEFESRRKERVRRQNESWEEATIYLNDNVIRPAVDSINTEDIINKTSEYLFNPSKIGEDIADALFEPTINFVCDLPGNQCRDQTWFKDNWNIDAEDAYNDMKFIYKFGSALYSINNFRNTGLAKNSNPTFRDRPSGKYIKNIDGKKIIRDAFFKSFGMLYEEIR
jgi:RHS repeat-associated protein